MKSESALPANASDSDSGAVLNAFLQLALEDRQSGRTRSLADYQDLFPGKATLVAEEHARIFGTAPRDSEPLPPKTLDAFRSAYAADRAAGLEHSLEHYVERFPGADLEVARAFASLAVGEALDAADPLESGVQLGAYRIVREIGRGGQGIVYEALDEALGRPVALKLLTGLNASSPERLRRFRREAAIGAHLDHPGICAVFGAGTYAGFPYVAMRFIEGETLDVACHSLSPDSEIDPARDARLGWIESVARTLHAAHEAHVVHRDIKPSNLMVTPSGETVVLDFGLARLDEDPDSLTRSGEALGTPAYMSPEQVQSRGEVDRRTDVYSLGVCLFEAVTGSRPFRAPTRSSLFHEILSGRTPDPRAIQPHVSRDLAVVIQTAMARDADDRYRTALDFAEDLAALRTARPIAALPTPWWRRARRWAQREPAQAALAAGLSVALLVAAGVGGYLIRKAPALEAGTKQIEREELASMLDSSLRGGRSAMDDYLAVDADNVRARAVAALSRLITAEPAEALALLDTAPVDVAPQPALRRVRAAVLKSLGRADEAFALEAELPEPTGEVDAYVAGQLLHLRGDSAAARRYAERAVLLSSEPHFAYYALLAEAAVRSENRDLAQDALTVLEARWPDHKVSQLCLGEFHLMSPPDYAASERAYGRAVEIDPDDTLAHAGRAWALLGTGDIEAFRRHRDRALELFTEENVDGRYAFRVGLAILQAEFQNPDGALEELEAAIVIDPERTEAHLQRARALLRLGEPELARESLDYVLRIDPANADAQALWAELPPE